MCGRPLLGAYIHDISSVPQRHSHIHCNTNQWRGAGIEKGSDMSASEKNRTIGQWSFTVAGYIFLAIVGTFVVLFATAFSRAKTTSEHLAEANRLLTAGKPGASLSYLNRVEHWASNQPSLEKRRICTAIRCQVRRSSLDEARVLARDMVDVCREHTLPGSTAGILISTPSDLIDATLLAYDSGQALSKWAGYRILIEELRKANETETLEEVKGDVLALASGRNMPPEIQVAMTSRQSLRGKISRPPSHSRVETVAAKPSTDAGPVERWGIVIANGANSYDTKGKYMEDIPVGTVVNIKQIKALKAGTLAICSPADEAGDLFLVRTRALDIRTGSRNLVGQKEMTLLIKQAQLSAKLQALRDQAAKDYVSRNNPFAEEYGKAKGEYRAYWKKVKDLQAKRDSSTGDERMRCGDELREMMGQSVDLGNAYKEAKSRYEEWNQSHAASASPPENPDVASLKSQLEGVKAKLQSI